MTAIRLIIANIAMFLILKVTWLFSPEVIDQAVGMLALPSGASRFATLPWTAFTYMFLHFDFWHLLVNVLWLAWFGALLGHIAGGRWVIADYLAGGIAGAASYLFLTSALPVEADTVLVGASAATLSVVAATLISAPEKKVEIPFIGPLPLKWLAAAGLGVFVCASLDMSAGQTAAHLGGLATGIISGIIWRTATRRQMRRMKALARDRLIQLSLVKKARQSGYASLSRDERLQLFNLSSRDSRPGQTAR